MKKGGVILIVILIIIAITLLLTTVIKKYNDPRLCKIDYQNKCVLIVNKKIKFAYFKVSKECASTDCKGNKIDSSNCKSSKKIYFKQLTNDQYDTLMDDVSKANINTWEELCKNVKEIMDKKIDN